jgi:hypothetical protein
MRTAKRIIVLASALLAAGCNGEVMLLESPGDGGGGDAASSDGTSQGYEDAWRPNPDAGSAWFDGAPYEPDGTVPYDDAWAPYPDGGWYDDAPYQGDATYGADVACPISDDAGNCSRICCEAQLGGPAWTPVPVSLPCTYADWVCLDDAGMATDDAGTDWDAGCDHWCCEPPPGGRGYPALACVPLGVTCTLPAADCEASDAGWAD